MGETRESKYQSPGRAILTGISDLFKKPEGSLKLGDLDRLDGKNVLITGASSGLGFATAVEVARRGANLIMVNRSGYPDKVELIKKRSGSDRVDMIKADLSDLNNLKNVVSQVKQKAELLDIIICNAAMVASEGRQLPNGQDQMFTVNYLAKFIMINTLINEDCIRFNGDTIPRIIIVTSESHRNAREIDWDKFGVFEPYNMKRSVELYGYYKLLLVTFVNELSRRLNEKKIRASVFSLCPGPVNTNIAREAPAIFQPLLRLVFAIFFRSPARACKPVVYLATAPEMEGKPIDYLFLMQRKEMDPKATDPENGKRLWEESRRLVSTLLNDE